MALGVELRHGEGETCSLTFSRMSADRGLPLISSMEISTLSADPDACCALDAGTLLFGHDEPVVARPPTR